MSEQNTEFENWWDLERARVQSGRHTPKDACLLAYQQATAEANKRIDALEGEVAELKAELKSEKEHSNILLKNGGEFYRNELALKAHINTLREALKFYAQFSDSRISEHAKIALEKYK